MNFKPKPLSKGAYRWTRNLHLVFGLFLIPYVLLFAISAILLNHGWAPQATGSAAGGPTTVKLTIPEAFERSKDLDQVRLARSILDQAGVEGEIGRITAVGDGRCFLIPVSKPGQQTMVELDLDTETAQVEVRNTGMWNALNYLHKSPGPHSSNIRGNWYFTKLWRSFADAAVFLLLFVSASGVYLWAAIKKERKTGLVLVAAGSICFLAGIYALVS